MICLYTKTKKMVPGDVFTVYQLEGREEADPEKRIPHQKRGSGLGTGRTVKTGCQTGYEPLRAFTIFIRITRKQE